MGKDNPQTLTSLDVDSARRHAFLCLGPDCCAEEEGQAAWETLKGELKKAKAPVLRTRAACLRLCQRGPWMVVYPEGTWYAEVSPERCREIVQSHLVAGIPLPYGHTVPPRPPPT